MVGEPTREQRTCSSVATLVAWRKLQAQPMDLFPSVLLSVPLAAWLPTGHCLCVLGGCTERYNAGHYMVKAVHKDGSTCSPVFHHSLCCFSAAPVQLPQVRATLVCCARCSGRGDLGLHSVSSAVRTHVRLCERAATAAG